jgi:hypothetical protein
MAASEFYRVDLNKARIKWWQWLYLWALPTYVVLEGDSVHRFKKHKGHIFYVGESHD